MAAERARGPGRGAVIAIGAVLLAALVILLVTQVEDRGGPRQSIPGARVLPVAAVAAAPERYLGERLTVSGEIRRQGEAGFVLADGRRALIVLGPTGGPFPRVRRGEAVRVRGVLRTLEPREARRIATDPRLPAPGSGPALVATSVDSLVPQAPQGEAVRP